MLYTPGLRLRVWVKRIILAEKQTMDKRTGGYQYKLKKEEDLIANVSDGEQ
jgi:hypothetical protein